MKIVHDDESENEKDSEDFGGIFHKREKTKEDKEKEEEEYRQWLAGKKKELENKNEVFKHVNIFIYCVRKILLTKKLMQNFKCDFQEHCAKLVTLGLLIYF